MAHDWIIDVLTDLRAYARANGLPHLAEQLDETHLAARKEIASQAKGSSIGLRAVVATDGFYSGAAGMRRNP